MSSPTNPVRFPVVGVGASAGGVAALKRFFENTPADCGMAFVVIMHLSAEYESNLAEILQTCTSMKVVQVKESTAVAPENVYVIPPGKHLTIRDGRIEFAEPERSRGQRLPLDLFFRTLAAAYQKDAVAVILSGSGCDGMLGLQRVKEEGGLVVAQSPEEAEYDGMPSSAISTNLVDAVLPVAEISRKILAFRAIGRKLNFAESELQEAGPVPDPAAGVQERAAEAVLPAAVSVSPRRILIVDDNVDATAMMQVLLRSDRHSIRIAHDGGSALEIATTFIPEVALLDIGLPDLDGYEVGKILRAKYPGIVLAAISGWGQEEDLRKSSEAGFDHHLVKPVEIDAVKKLIA